MSETLLCHSEAPLKLLVEVCALGFLWLLLSLVRDVTQPLLVENRGVLEAFILKRELGRSLTAL